MRRILAFLLVVLLLLAMVIPACAIELPEIEVDFNIKIPQSFWDKWFSEHPFSVTIPNTTESTESDETDPSEVVELDTPTITESKYVHKTPYYGMKAHLSITWTAVDGAEYYEVQITKADGTADTYTVESTILYSTTIKCPRVYVEETSTWTAASVQVRAVSGDTVSEWSEAEKISCDMMHRR